jgi:hypothetical protein
MASAETLLALQAHGNLHACRHDVTQRLWTLRNQVLEQLRNHRIVRGHIRCSSSSKNTDACVALPAPSGGRQGAHSQSL